MFDLFLFFHYYGHQDVCSQCRENKSVPSIFFARGRFREIVLKIGEILTLIS